MEVVGRSATNVPIKSTYGETDSVEYQDNLGKIIEAYISRIPDGTVCFLPSYRLLNTLVSRWKIVGIWKKMEISKKIYIEPHRGEELAGVLQQYYSSVDSGRGALLFAVCRGKVSEGINFSDQYARAVLVVGIPFPSLREPQVMLKKAYNSKHSKKRGLLSGDKWYSQQAFRALNQALGRCIRHAKDYGAILLIGM